MSANGRGQPAWGQLKPTPHVRAPQGPGPRVGLLCVLVCLLSWLPQPVTGKYACEYSNSLCQWSASYAFGATVLEDKVFYQGGTQAGGGQVNSSSLEVFDLQSLSPLVLESSGIPDQRVSSRYGHLLATWRSGLLLLGGKHKTATALTQDDNHVWSFDVNSRSWQPILGLPEQPAVGDRTFEAVDVSGDTLLSVVQLISDLSFSRSIMVLDLKGVEDKEETSSSVRNNTVELPVPSDPVKMLDWRLVGLLADIKGAGSALAVHSKREIPSASSNHSQWFMVDDVWQDSKAAAVDLRVSSRFKVVQGHQQQPPAGRAAQVLVLKLLWLQRRPALVVLATTDAFFANGVKRRIAVVMVHNVTLSGQGKGRQVLLQLQHLLLTPPLNMTLDRLASVDLPFHGRVALGARDVSVLPYVGELDLVGPGGDNNANIQQTADGFIIRGLGRADQSCQPGADWKPFLIMATFKPQGGPPQVTVRSNYSFCPSRAAQAAAERVAADTVALTTNGQLMRIDSKQQGPLLMLLSTQTRPNSGTHPEFFKFSEAPLMGAYISLRNNRVDNFTIEAPKDYMHPARVSSCLTDLKGSPVYVETGGITFLTEQDRDVMPAGVFTMHALGVPKQHRLVLAAGSKAVPTRAQAALACGPDGQVWLFGGVSFAGAAPKKGERPSFVPSDELTALQLSSSSSSGAATRGGDGAAGGDNTRVAISSPASATGTADKPSPRSGHAMMYLPQAVAAKLGPKKGALLLYGGSGVEALSLNALSFGDESSLYPALSNTTWDTATWLYDVSTQAWSRLPIAGDPPPRLMYHAMTLAGSQVIMFAGQEFIDDKTNPILQSTTLYVLDLAVSPLRWRRADVSNLAVQGSGFDPLAFPCVSAAAMPEQKVIALKYWKTLHIIPNPQTLVVDNSTIQGQRWGLTSLNVTAGDWVRLVAVSGSAPVVPLSQPLILSGDVIFTGVVQGANTATASSQQQKGAAGGPTLQCVAGAGQAIVVSSAGVEVENFTICGCNDTALEATFSVRAARSSSSSNPRSALSARSVKLRGLVFSNNSGEEAVAVNASRGVVLRMSNCTFRGNTATDSIVQAEAGAVVNVSNCRFEDNSGTALVFKGQSLTVANSSFVRNRADPGALQKRYRALQQGNSSSGAVVSKVAALAAWETDDLGSEADAGALRVPGVDQQQADAQASGISVTVVSSSFINNTGGAGGAVYAGPRSLLQLQDCTLSGNKAAWLGGGAVFAYRDACLQAVNSTFTGNGQASEPTPPGVSFRATHGQALNTTQYGGAIYGQNPSCNLEWSGISFSDNAASREGGAVFIRDLTSRKLQLKDCTLRDNKALLGPGGALSIHAYSSTVSFEGCELSGNTATEGGGMYVRSSMTFVQLKGCNASRNKARGSSSSSSSSSPAAGAAGGAVSAKDATHHGGALSMSGSVSELLLNSCSFDANDAQGQGGAIFVEGAGGELGDSTSGMFVQLTNGTSISNNTSLRQGGGVHVSKAQLHMIAAELAGNSVGGSSEGVAASEEAGGGLYCSSCEAYLQDSVCRGNTGALGGGCYFSNTQSAHISGVRFLDNAVGVSSSSSSSSSSSGGGGGVPGSAAGAAASSGDSTGQADVRYHAGGALFVDATNVSLVNLTFINNTAPVAGGIYLQLPKQDRAAWLQQGDSTSSQANLTDVRLQAMPKLPGKSGNDMLLDGPIAWVRVPKRCESPGSKGHAECVAKAVYEWQQQVSRRKLLQESAAGLMSDSLFNPESSSKAPTTLFATSAVKLVSLTPLKGNNQVLATSNRTLDELSLQLQDALGKPVKQDISDASMPIVAKLYRSTDLDLREPVTDISMIGNLTSAKQGVATFDALQIFPNKGDKQAYMLVFNSLRGLEQPLRLNLTTEYTECEIGQRKYRTGSAVAAGNGSSSFKCFECPAPTYSFFPEAGNCSRCPSKAVCNQFYALPVPGSYNSHPRNPLILDCLLPGACKRGEAAQQKLLNFTTSLRFTATANITQEDLNTYSGLMCLKGYMGPLCGACDPQHGRSGMVCAECFKPAVHVVLFVLVGLVMLVWVGFQGWLHVNQVRRNHNDIQQQVLEDILTSITTQQSSYPQQQLQLSMQPGPLLGLASQQQQQLSNGFWQLPPQFQQQQQQQQLSGAQQVHLVQLPSQRTGGHAVPKPPQGPQPQGSQPPQGRSSMDGSDVAQVPDNDTQSSSQQQQDQEPSLQPSQPQTQQQQQQQQFMPLPLQPTQQQSMQQMQQQLMPMHPMMQQQQQLMPMQPTQQQLMPMQPTQRQSMPMQPAQQQQQPLASLQQQRHPRHAALQQFEQQQFLLHQQQQQQQLLWQQHQQQLLQVQHQQQYVLQSSQQQQPQQRQDQQQQQDQQRLGQQQNMERSVQARSQSWASEPHSSRDGSTSRPDSLTMGSPWVVAGTNDPHMASRLASDSSGQGSISSGSRASAAAARQGSLRARYNSQGSLVSQQQATGAVLPSVPSNGSASGGPDAGAAAGASAGPAMQELGVGTGMQLLPPQFLQPLPQQQQQLPTQSSSSSGSVGQQLRSMVSGLFNAEVLHDAARARRRRTSSGGGSGPGLQVAGLQPQQQQQQQGVGTQPEVLEHTWIADMFKLLTSHLQILGLLRPLRIKWPEVFQALLQHMDPSSALMAWARLECSMTEPPEGSAHMRRSIYRSIVLLLSPVVAAVAVVVLWSLWVAAIVLRNRRQPLQQRPPLNIRTQLLPVLVLYVVLVLFFLYPQVSREIVSTMSCHPVDNLDRFIAAAPEECQSNDLSKCDMQEAVGALQHNETYWSNDTLVPCFRGSHLAVLVLGVLGLVFFAVGLPVSLFVVLGMLSRQKSSSRDASGAVVVKDPLQERHIDLQLGFLYASYRRRYYFWEGVVLLEKLAMVVCITLLQGVSVGLQVLMAIGVIFISATLQVTFKPFACKLLDTLQRISFYSLQVTLFLLMVASFDDLADEATRIGLLVVVAVINAAVLVMFVTLITRGVCRMLSNLKRAGATWSAMRAWVRDRLPQQLDRCEGCCLRLREVAAACNGSNPNGSTPPAAAAAAAAQAVSSTQAVNGPNP